MPAAVNWFWNWTGLRRIHFKASLATARDSSPKSKRVKLTTRRIGFAFRRTASARDRNDVAPERGSPIPTDVSFAFVSWLPLPKPKALWAGIFSKIRRGTMFVFHEAHGWLRAFAGAEYFGNELEARLAGQDHLQALPEAAGLSNGDLLGGGFADDALNGTRRSSWLRPRRT